ncbi:MAG: Mth938-like domain-containing protein [Rubrivivax sp.]|jgi:uncharacterized protein|nr:Mth938-like domain-containing protein [Rubrivivax sp.]
MKFQPERAEGVNVIARHEPQRLWVNAQVYTHSVLVPWQGAVLDWGVTSVDALEVSHFERILELQPALVIFGSGLKLQFVKPALYRSLIERGIGLETMDTAAACRTYNVLASEGRTVVGALLMPTPAAQG